MQSTLSIDRPVASQNRKQQFGLAAYYFTFATLGIAAFVLGPTLPSLAEQTNSRLELISYIFAAQSAGSILGGWWLARYYDRMPAHRLVALLLTLYMVTLGVTPLTPNLWLLALDWFILGMILAAIHVGMNTMMVWVFGSNVGPYLNGLHFCFSISAFVAPVIITHVILTSGGVAWAYWLLALLLIPGVLILLALPSPPAPPSITTAASVKIDYVFIALGMIFLASFVGVELGATGWIFTYTLKTGLGTAQTGAYMMSTLWGAVMLGRLLAIYTSTILRPRTILYANLSGDLLGVIVIGLAGSSSLPMLGIGTFILGFSMSSTFPTSLAMFQRRINLTGQTTGILLMGASFGGMTLPWLIGQFIDQVGPYTMPLILAASLLLALVMLTVILRYPHPHPSSRI